MTGFAQLFKDTRNALSGNGVKAIARFDVSSQGKNGLHREVKIRDFSVEVDEPPDLPPAAIPINWREVQGVAG